jgi:hypothetical protein
MIKNEPLSRNLDILTVFDCLSKKFIKFEQ